MFQRRFNNCFMEIHPIINPILTGELDLTDQFFPVCLNVQIGPVCFETNTRNESINRGKSN